MGQSHQGRRDTCRLKSALVTLACTALTIGVSPAAAQSYPVKTVRIVTTSAGGGNDALSRLIAAGIAGALGQQVIVDNRTATVAPVLVTKAPADGYTLLVGTGSVWLSQLFQKVEYDVLKDLVPVALATQAANVLVVHPSLPVTNVKALIALARARPGQLNYSSGASGSSAHLSGELFRVMTGVNIVRIPYKDNSMQISDLVSGRIETTFGAVTQVKPLAESGKLRALAVSTSRTSALFPALPTIAAAGVPGYESGTDYGVWFPAATPPAAVTKISLEIARLLKSAEGRERALAVGMDAVGSTPEELDAHIRKDLARLGKVIRDAGIRAE